MNEHLLSGKTVWQLARARALDLTPRLVKHRFHAAEKQFNSLVSLFSRELPRPLYPSHRTFPNLYALLVYMRELSRPHPVCHLSLLHLPRSYKRDSVIINLGRIQYNIVRVEYRSINSRLVYRARQIETGREYQGEVKDNFEEHETNPRGSIEYLMSIAIETEMVQICSKEKRESICGPWYRVFFSVCVRARD